MVSYQRNYEVQEYFYYEKGIFLTESESDRSISIATHDDYLSFKVFNESFIYLMAVCQTGYRYDSKELSCVECTGKNKSFGI